MVRARIQPDRISSPWRRLAISIAAAALVTTACGQATTPSTDLGTTVGGSVAPTASADPSSTISPAPLPGGRLVYLALNEEGVGSLVTTNLHGTDTTPLLSVGNPPRWSPDGRRISVVADTDDGLVFTGLVDPDGSHYVQFDSPDPTLNLGCWAWSPDGTRLACEGWDETDLTRNGIYTVRASDGGDPIRVTTSPDGGHDIPTDYSPDGQQVVFTRQAFPDEADTTLMVVNVDGSSARALSDRRLGLGRWSRDGNNILTDTGESLLLVPIDGSEIRTIEIVSDSLTTAFFASWSPDGEWIVFSGRASKSVDLYIVRADGTNLHQVTDTPIGHWEEAADWAAAAP